MQKRSGLSWEINSADDIREAFVNGTGLQNRTDNNYHAVNKHLRRYRTTTPWDRDNSRLEERNAYYWANFTSINDIIRDALDHFDDALAASIELDNKLLAAANSISTEYAGLVSLVTRSAMSAIEYTINIDDNGNDISDVKAFMKNMGNVGSGQINAVDVIYAAMPIYLYLNPDIIGYLLSPLLDAQSSSLYFNNYAAIDLGGPFPNATGNIRGHSEGIEQSANMIILTLAHAQASGNGDFIIKYYDLLSKWGDYLIDNTLSPANQTTSSSDNINSINQTNLILKGIIGIRAMAEISSLTDYSADATKYKIKADQYYQSWKTVAILLGLNVVDYSVYETQTSYYGTHLSQQEFGVALDASNSNLSRSDWILFAASATTDTQVRDVMIGQVYNYANSSFDDMPFPVVYNLSDGRVISGLNSPAQGAIFAPLALNVNKSVVTFTPDPRATNSGAS
ncbi:hypothetical protein PNOK_0903800 [Pyrrhoderma noxium]|uniref:Glutaminase A central domain-containing protein n=1 Tax=Pyrrhoderma noxium TaxID=2282107 RepID=A0A286U6T0_9AGAM|nr:hypothetical protein PNOK_0903800 [Pyrrhoderma noxium]